MNEVAVRVCYEDEAKEATEKDFIFHQDYNVQKCKSEICDAFNLEPNQFSLFRYDDFGEARFQIRKEKVGWFKNNVTSGDTLALCSNSGITSEEKLHLSIHYTASGYPDDCKFLGEIDVLRSIKLDDLKEHIVTMQRFKDQG